MNLNPDSSRVQDGNYRPMPKGYRILFWLIILDFLALTAWVWILAYRAVDLVEKGAWIQIQEFGRLMMGYHIMLLVTSSVGWIMQVTWRTRGEMGLFLYTMVVGTLSLNIAAAQLALIIYNATD